VSFVPLGEESATGVESEFASGAGCGGVAGEGMAGDVMLSRASGICAASGVGVEGSIGSRYGSTSL
jgi:hypothetical protein